MSGYPLKVRHKIFQKKMMGYDPDEVTEFLGQLSKEMESLIRDKKTLTESLGKQDNLVENFAKKDHILQKSIINATEIAEQIKQDAYDQSQETMQSARNKAASLLQNADKELEIKKEELIQLKRTRVQFEKDFRKVLYEYVNSLDERGQTQAPPLPSPQTQAQRLPNQHPTQTESFTPPTQTSTAFSSQQAKEKVTEVLGVLLKDVKLF